MILLNFYKKFGIKQREDKMADSRLILNIKGISAYGVPRKFFHARLAKVFEAICKRDDEVLSQMQKRLHYYNQISSDFSDILQGAQDKEHINKFPFSKTTHYFDSYKITKYFKDELWWIKRFGDVREHLSVPSICKSRLIEKGNENNILLKLGKDRHYDFVEDRLKFEDKKPKAVWRGANFQANREAFLRAYAGFDFCDIADARTNKVHIRANYLNKRAQMGFKYIISLEGNDVASNLKWAMHSNSLVITQKLKYETWFMEGCLKAGEHFVLCDNENLGEVVEYYNTHTSEAKAIIDNAHAYVAKFLDDEMEFHLGILVMAKYFYYSGQIELPNEILQLIKK